MKPGRALLICCLFIPVAAFALAHYHPFGNPNLYGPHLPEASIVDPAIPQQVRSILVEKCANCHSNKTNAPIYGRFAPISWLLERDVVEARKAMNLSAWGTYPDEKRQILLAQILHEVRSGAMPPLQYQVVHWHARINDSDLSALGQLKIDPGDRSDAVHSGLGDPMLGKQIFEKRCTGCHALAQNHEGPRLQGVYGRTSGTLADFTYSKALQKAHIVWDERSLDKWLTDPEALVPGNEMDFLVSKSQERRDLISYLRQVSRR